jgi:hypothetical protein
MIARRLAFAVLHGVDALVEARCSGTAVTTRCATGRTGASGRSGGCPTARWQTYARRLRGRPEGHDDGGALEPQADGTPRVADGRGSTGAAGTPARRPVTTNWRSSASRGLVEGADEPVLPVQSLAVVPLRHGHRSPLLCRGSCSPQFRRGAHHGGPITGIGSLVVAPRFGAAARRAEGRRPPTLACRSVAPGSRTQPG